MHDADIVAEFTQQAETFNDSATARSELMLDRLIALAQPGSDERWLEAACGPGSSAAGSPRSSAKSSAST